MSNKWERRKTTNQESEPPKTYAHLPFANAPSQDLGLTEYVTNEDLVHTNSRCADESLRQLTKEEFPQQPKSFTSPTDTVKAPPSGNPRRTFSSIAAQAKQEAKQSKEYTEPMEFEGPVDFIKKLIVHRKHVSSELKSRVKTLADSLELQALQVIEQVIEQAIKQRKAKLK